MTNGIKLPPQHNVQVQRNLKTHASFPAALNYKGLHPMRIGEAVIDIEENLLIIGDYKWHLTPHEDNASAVEPPPVSENHLVSANGVPLLNTVNGGGAQ